MKIKYLILGITFFIVISCQQPGANKTGSEFMPDMAHSVAYEANYYNYYYYNTWGSEDEYYDFAKPKLPVAGSIPRSKNTMGDNSVAYKANGSVPYHFGNTEEERVRATSELVNNPYPISDKGLAIGKELYTVFCAICHGDQGDGAGYLVREDGGKYPVQPANLLLEEFVAASNGRYYHGIMYGKNLMGSYKDKLSYEERWQVIHYIRSLQAKSLKLAYDEQENTLNMVDIPAATLMNKIIENEVSMSEDHGEHVSDNEHSETHH